MLSVLKKNILILSAVTLIAGVALPESVFAGNYNKNECNIDVDLQGSVTRNHAEVVNYSKNLSCKYEATLAVYDSPQEPNTFRWIETQKLIDSKTIIVNAGERTLLEVSDSGEYCWKQADLVRGKYVLEPPVYVNAMASDVYKTGNCEYNEVTPTPTQVTTPTLTPTPTNSPTNTPTPGATNTPTPTPTGIVQSATNSVNKSSFAKTGNSAFVFAAIVAGAVSLLAGLVLRRFAK